MLCNKSQNSPSEWIKMGSQLTLYSTHKWFEQFLFHFFPLFRSLRATCKRMWLIVANLLKKYDANYLLDGTFNRFKSSYNSNGKANQFKLISIFVVRFSNYLLLVSFTLSIYFCIISNCFIVSIIWKTETKTKVVASRSNRKWIFQIDENLFPFHFRINHATIQITRILDSLHHFFSLSKRRQHDGSRYHWNYLEILLFVIIFPRWHFHLKKLQNPSIRVDISVSLITSTLCVSIK